MTSNIKCRAVTTFTRFVSGYGMVHGDPDSQDEKASEPSIPEHVVAQFVDDGLIEAPDILFATFEMKHIKFGTYLITGPGVEPNTIIKGKKDAQEYLDLLIATGGTDDSDGAPF